MSVHMILKWNTSCISSKVATCNGLRTAVPVYSETILSASMQLAAFVSLL